MIRVTGVAQTLAALAGAALRAEAALNEGKRVLGEEVAETARTSHPWNNVTGETEASIQVTETGVTAGGASIYLEFGTSKMAARPFLRPAADSANGDAAADAARAAIIGVL